MEKLDEQLNLVIQDAWAQSTLSTRNSQWLRYIRFCNANHLVAVPATTLTVARFLIHLAASCVYSTCNNYLSSIVVLHKFMGENGGFRESYLITLVLKGLARRLGKQVNQKIGLSPDQLLSMYNTIDFSSVNDITMWTAIILSFRTLLRKSNLVQTTYKDPGLVVQRSDVIFNSKGLILQVRKSKTIQNTERVLEVPVFYTKTPGLCAATMLDTHLLRTSQVTEGPLFYVFSKKGDLRPLLYKDLLAFIKSKVTTIGLNPSEVGLHSLRRSGTGFLHSIGISLVDIMIAGDWKSLAALSYLISPLSRKNEIETEVVHALNNY